MPEEFNLQMKVDVEGLRMEIILSQPSSFECDTSPRRAAVDTGSDEPEGEIFSFEASMDGFFS